MDAPLGTRAQTPLVFYVSDEGPPAEERARLLRGGRLPVVGASPEEALSLLATTVPSAVVFDCGCEPGPALRAHLETAGIPQVRLASGFFASKAPARPAGAPLETDAVVRSIARLRAILGSRAIRLELYRGNDERCQVRGWDAARLPRRPAQSREVLVIDDHEDSRELFAELLRERGHRVVTAGNGHDGLVLAHAGPFDVVALDIDLPGRSGLEVARRIREDLGEGPFLIAMTGFGGESERRETAKAGFDVHLVKPVDFEVLALAVAAAGTK